MKKKRRVYSIQLKTTLLTVCAIIVAITVAIVISVVFVKRIGNNSSKQLLLLLCETGEKNLDYYFGSVEQSVEMVSTYVTANLENTDDEHFADHVERVREIFGKTALKTNGVLTYYYRIDPSVPTTEKGFWYTDLDGSGFVEHEVTDITLYDTTDTSSLVWFTVPKSTGKAIWLPSYITDNLDVRVISYNVPVYRNNEFIGIVGIEIDYKTMAAEVDSIQPYTNGYAFVCDAQGNIVYHPRMDDITNEDELPVPDGLLSKDTYVTYTYEGVKKQAAWLPLSNGMRLVVTVPVDEVNAEWQPLIYDIIIAAAVLLTVFIVVTIFFTRHFTKPLRKLSDIAEELNEGNYNVKLEYKDNDEIGVLTQTFNRLVTNLRGYISDLNSLAYGDSLTSVRNKGAFDTFVREIQARIDDPEDEPRFAIGIFDCDNLKHINDTYGHEKGDMYLKNSSHFICRIFQSSPVFRIGGDEFAVILQNDDYKNRDSLAKYFTTKSNEICAFANGQWEEVKVAMGIAAYDPNTDKTVEDVIRRADQLMYDNKRERKNN